MRYESIPVRRHVYGLTSFHTIGDETVKAETDWHGDDQLIAYAVLPVRGGVGAIRRLDDEGKEWAAAGSTGGWLPETYPSIQDAIDAAIAAGEEQHG